MGYKTVVTLFSWVQPPWFSKHCFLIIWITTPRESLASTHYTKPLTSCSPGYSPAYQISIIRVVLPSWKQNPMTSPPALMKIYCPWAWGPPWKQRPAWWDDVCGHSSWAAGSKPLTWPLLTEHAWSLFVKGLWIRKCRCVHFLCEWGTVVNFSLLPSGAFHPVCWDWALTVIRIPTWEGKPALLCLALPVGVGESDSGPSPSIVSN